MTLNGWVYGATNKEVSFAKRYLRVRDRNDLPDAMLRLTWSSVAELAVGQIQDFLHEPADARMNTPSTSFGNWQYRTNSKQFNHKLSKKIYQLNALYNRLPEAEPEETADIEEREEDTDA
jgi:4-alpha-glucanotransferase